MRWHQTITLGNHTLIFNFYYLSLKRSEKMEIFEKKFIIPFISKVKVNLHSFISRMFKKTPMAIFGSLCDTVRCIYQYLLPQEHELQADALCNAHLSLVTYWSLRPPNIQLLNNLIYTLPLSFQFKMRLLKSNKTKYLKNK